MMKYKYETPELEIIKYNSEDIITTSNEELDGTIPDIDWDNLDL